MNKYQTAAEKKEGQENSNHSNRTKMLIAVAILVLLVLGLGITYIGARKIANELGHDKVTWQHALVFHTWLGFKMVGVGDEDSDRSSGGNDDPGENLLDRVSVVPKESGPSTINLSWHLNMNQPRTLTLNGVEHEIKLVMTSTRMAGISVDGEVIFMGKENPLEVNGLELILESVEDGKAVVMVTHTLEETIEK